MASREKEEALEHLLYQAMQQPDGKEQEAQLIAQNNLLKIEMQKRKQMKRISLCYLPGHLKRCDFAFDGDGCLHSCADSIRSVFGSDFGCFVGDWRNGSDPSGHPLF